MASLSDLGIEANYERCLEDRVEQQTYCHEFWLDDWSTSTVFGRECTVADCYWGSGTPWTAHCPAECCRARNVGESCISGDGKCEPTDHYCKGHNIEAGEVCPEIFQNTVCPDGALMTEDRYSTTLPATVYWTATMWRGTPWAEKWRCLPYAIKVYDAGGAGLQYGTNRKGTPSFVVCVD